VTLPRRCSIAASLEVVGERWSLLVLREVSLGNRRFEQIRVATGAPRAVLSARLRSLVEAGVLRTCDYREEGARVRQEYRLTAAGRELQPVLTALMDWGDRHLAGPDGPPVRLAHEECGADVHAVLVCDAGHALADPRALRAVPAP
jgi:DNA-binding HxlR family transcriptional regulator